MTVWVVCKFKQWFHYEHGVQVWEDALKQVKTFESKKTAVNWIKSRRHQGYKYADTHGQNYCHIFKQINGQSQIYYKISRQKVY